MKKINILFFASVLKGGGAEKNFIRILKSLNNKKFHSILVLSRNEIAYDFIEDIKVKKIILNKKRAFLGICQLIKIIKNEKIDIVFSTTSNPVVALIAFIFSFFNSTTRFVVREPNNIGNYLNFNNPERLKRLLAYKLFYPKLDKVICLTEEMKNEFKIRTNLKPKQLTKIANPAPDFLEIKKFSEKKIKKHRVNMIAVGRLTHQKGFDLLLKTLSLLNDNFHLTILGKGKDKDKLEKLCLDLDLNKRVNFIGFTQNPHEYMATSDMLILSSRYEGLPNVVIESLALGVPVVAFRCSGGHKALIKNNKNGFLAQNGNIYDLAEKIKLCSNTKFDKKKIKKEILKNLDSEIIMQQYQQLFRNIL